MAITSSPFGALPDGRPVDLFTLTNKHGLRVTITNYGGIVVSIETPDRDGNLADIVLGRPDLQGYLDGHPYFGAITGRVAGRITGAQFELNGVIYELEKNDGENNLHGGTDGFDKQLWEAEIIQEADEEVLSLFYTDPHLHNNFPGNLDCTVEYCLTDANELRIDYQLETDKPTPHTVTNHSYFNLKGEGNGDILDHTLQILADTYAVTDDNCTITGEIQAVDAKSGDFRQPVILRDCIADIHLRHGAAFFLNGGRTEEPRLVARVTEPTTGRTLECLTTEPNLQFYSSSMMEPATPGKRTPYDVHSAFCLEAQACPEAVNQDQLGDIILHPGDVFTSTTIYRFGVE